MRRSAAAVLVVAAACHSRPTAGTSCRLPDQLVCGGTDRALVCEPAPGSGAMTWIEVPCRGARGCARAATVDECDDTVAQEGNPCPRSPPLDYACTPDHTKALVCKDGRFGLWRACRGPDACLVEEGRNVRCDTTLGEPGDPCAQQGTYACSVDRLWMLSCDGTALGPASSCRGPDGCRVQRSSRKVDCDDAVVVEGDPCDQDKRIACALDRKAELVCTHGKYAKKRDCRHGNCRLDGNELYCD